MKVYKVILLDNAITDASNAKKWYEKQQKGLGKRFSKDLENTLLRISRTPFSFAIRHNDNRKANFETFPFGAFFLIREAPNIIYILAIKHNAVNILE